MTTKPVTPFPDAGVIVQFPDAPPEEMTAYHQVNFPGYPGALFLHFGNPESTVIISEIAAGLFATESREGIRYPDLLISFNANPAAIIPRNGYLIPEQGKPPDFVLEVASKSTGDIDEDEKRRDYARFRVPEYWRFDPSGGNWHSAPLAGDRLIGDEYRPITIHRTHEGHFWGHSDALNLDLCWESGELRLYDPVAQRYLPDFQEKDAQHRAAEARAETEAARAETEATRAETEATRAEAEATRAETEATRADAEAARADAEATRAETETARADAEAARANAQAARAETETARADAEAARANAEAARANAQAARADAQEARVRELKEELRRLRGE